MLQPRRFLRLLHDSDELGAFAFGVFVGGLFGEFQDEAVVERADVGRALHEEAEADHGGLEDVVLARFVPFQAAIHEAQRRAVVGGGVLGLGDLDGAERDGFVQGRGEVACGDDFIPSEDACERSTIGWR